MRSIFAMGVSAVVVSIVMVGTSVAGDAVESGLKPGAFASPFDVEDITEDMTKRFEFEIDTTRAVASWQKEVAENIAKQTEGSTATP